MSSPVSVPPQPQDPTVGDGKETRSDVGFGCWSRVSYRKVPLVSLSLTGPPFSDQVPQKYLFHWLKDSGLRSVPQTISVYYTSVTIGTFSN